MPDSALHPVFAEAVAGFQRSARVARGVTRGRFYVSARLKGVHDEFPAWARTPAEAEAIVRDRLAGCGELRVLGVTELPDCLIDGADMRLLNNDAERRAAAAELARL